MKFVNRTKKILLARKEEELSAIEEKIKELNKIYSKEHEKVINLKQESDEVFGRKAEFQKNIKNKKEITDLEIIYDFVSNYPRIEKILARIKEMYPLNYNEYLVYPEIYTNEIVQEEGIDIRYQLYKMVKGLNEQIIEINDADIEKLQNDVPKDEQKQEENVETIEIENKKQEKRGIFSKLFGRKEKNKQPTTLERESNTKKEENIFDKYRKTINEYKHYYNGFLVMNLDDNVPLDRLSCTKIINTINYLLSVKKRGIKLEKYDEEYLKEMQPLELWNEILKYYSNTLLISGIIQNFENKIDNYEQLYKENPNLFNLENLERIFEENNQMIVDLKSKKKDATDKNNEFIRKKQDEKEMKSQLKNLENKKKDLIEKIGKIKKADTLKELGYKNKADAVKKLSIDTKDYVVIPIPNDIKDILDLFNEDKYIKVEIDGKTFFTVYSNDVAPGRVNSIDHLEKVNSALLVPINYLKKEDIDNIKSGKVSLNQSVLQFEKLLAILPEGRNLNFGDSKVEINRYSYGNINKEVEKFLGEDYVTDSHEIENYDIFKDVPNISIKEKKAKKEAVKECLFENLKRDIYHTDTILVNGKTYFLNQEDEKSLQLRKSIESLNEKKMMQIADEIETYLIEDGEKGAKIDYFYEQLLLEYMKVNKKSKADYQNENDTTISLKGKKMSIKPVLPAKNEMIAKRYSRPSEDIVYKTMKLANLVNKFAHLAENEELQKALYEVKLDLIEKTIDLSNNNANIKLKKQFDEKKMVMSVVLEIPKYNMIALHIMNKSGSLIKKSNQLEENENDVLQTSTIFLPGVNTELLLKMKGMNVEERMQALLNLDSNTFYKLALRMGYKSENIKSKNDKSAFIKNMVSDRKISELLKENNDLEK